jgi:four helix bundle protein
LVLAIYKITLKFPDHERYGLTAQIRRSAASVPTNIVEGHKRNGRKDFLHFLNIADSSLEETKYHILLAKDLGYVSQEDHEKISASADEIGRMLFGFQKRLKSYNL